MQNSEVPESLGEREYQRTEVYRDQSRIDYLAALPTGFATLLHAKNKAQLQAGSQVKAQQRWHIAKPHQLVSSGGSQGKGGCLYPGRTAESELWKSLGFQAQRRDSLTRIRWLFGEPSIHKSSGKLRACEKSHTRWQP